MDWSSIHTWSWIGLWIVAGYVAARLVYYTRYYFKHIRGKQR